MPVKDRKLQRQDFDGSAALKKLLEVGQSLAAIQDLGSLLQNVTESAGSALGADIVVLYEYQEETHDVNVPPVFWGDIRHPEVLRERGRVRLHRESAVFKMLSKRRKRPFYAPNAKKDWGRIIEQEPQEEGESGSFLHREDIASSAAVRLTADAERVGVLFVNYRTHHDFPDKERKVIELFATQAAAAIRDARLRADLQCQVERLQTLNQVSRELSAKLDKESIFDTVVKAVVRTLDCTHCTFFVLENNLLVPCASHSKGEEIEITRRFAVGEGLAGWAAQEGKAILARDAKKFKRFSEGKTRPTADRSMIVVPVKVGDQVVGIISADQDRVNAFDERDLRMVETLALQAGTAIQNANLLAQERRRADAMDLLQQVSAKISATLDEKETLALTVEGAMRVLRMESGVIHLVDDSKLAVTRSYEIPRGFGHPPPRLPKKEGLTWEIVSTGQMVDVPDIAEDKRVHPDMPTKEVKSIIGVPLEVEGRVIGALYMSDSKPREFTKYEKNLLSTLAGHAAIAIQNARLYEQRIRDIEAIQAINKAITAGEPSRTTTLDRILRLIVDRLVDVFQAASCAIRLYDPKLGGYGPRIASGALEKRVKFPPRLCGGSQHILETNKPIYAGDRSVVLPNGEPVIRQEIQKEGIRSVVYLPLLSERDVLGILYVEWTVPRQFFQNDRLILELFASQTAIAIENARLYNQRQNDIAAFQEINEAITTKEWSEIAMLIAQKAQELTHAEYSSLWLIDEKGKHLVMEAMYGYEAEVGRLLINKRSINGWVAMTGELYRCPDVREDPHYAKWYEDVRSNMTAPLTYGDRVIGTLTVESTRLDAFSDYQLGLLQSLADQAAVAIENAHLFKDARRRIRDLEIVNKVGQSISAQLNSQDLLQTIVSQIVDQLTCSHCTLFLLQKQNGEPVLVPQVTHGARREVMTRRFKPGEGLAGWVFQHGESLVLADARDDPRFAPYREEREWPRSMLVTPVKVGDQTIGVISADQDKFGWFSESDRRLVDALALQAGIAIQRAVGLELLQDIGNQIISLPRNVDEILQDIVHSAVKLTNTSTGVIYLISHDGRSVIKKFHPPDFDHPAPRMDRKDGLTRTAIATGEVLPIPDIRRDPRVNPTLCDRFQSLIAVPLRFEQRVIGVLYLNDEDSHDFTETEVSLLSTLANQAAIAVENARLYEQAQARLQERIDDIRALRDITALMRTAFLDDMLERIAEHAARLTPAKHAEVWLLDEQARELRFGAKNRLKEDTTQGLLALSLEEPSINARVALTKETYLCDDVEGNPYYRARYEDTRSELTTPLIYSGKVIGTLNLESTEVGVFTADHVRLVEALAGAAAVAIQNARLYETIRTLNEVGRVLTSGIRLREDEVLKLIHSQASKLMNTDNMYIALYDEETDTARFGLAFVDGRHVDIDNEKDRQPRKAGTGRTEWIIHNRRPILISTKAEAEAWHRQRGREERIGGDIEASWLGVPMMVGDKVLGVIAIYHPTWSYMYSRDDLDVLQAMASEAAIALDNVKQVQLRIEAERRAYLADLAQTTAHHLKNELGFIRPTAEIMLEDTDLDLSADYRKSLGMICRNASNAERLVARLFAPFRDLNLGRIRVDWLISEVTNSISPLLEGVELVDSYPQSLPDVYVDKLGTVGVCTELLTNAREAIRRGSRPGRIDITASLSKDGDWVEIQFTNNGPPIPPQLQEVIFHPRKEVETSGFGLGLWSARVLLERQGGSIHLVKSDEESTMFLIRLQVFR